MATATLDIRRVWNGSAPVRHLVPATLLLDYASLTDQQVVELARKGREPAYRELIGRYQRPVFSLIYRMVRDREKAEDLTQETFIKVLNAIERYDPSFKFSSWIFKIAHNTSLDHLRKKEPETLSMQGSPHARTDAEIEASTITPESGDENPEEYTSNRELGSEIDRAIGRLRPEYRTAIVLCHIEGRPYEEIAEIMDVPLGTVKTYIHRARNDLKKQLEHLRT
ncbi:MAG: sigma-70 family RNA polymerase sigma factor [Longimicrobiales bacterium]